MMPTVFALEMVKVFNVGPIHAKLSFLDGEISTLCLKKTSPTFLAVTWKPFIRFW